MKRINVLKFIDKYMRNAAYVVWCPTFSNVLYDSEDVFESTMSGSPLTIFNCMLVEDICVNGACVQINCVFQGKKWNRSIKYFENHLDELPVFDL